MKKLRPIVNICIALLVSMHALSQPANDLVYQISSEDTSDDLLPYLQILPDSLGLSIDNVLQPSSQEKFKAYTEIKSQLENKQYYWGKLDLFNATSMDDQWVVYLGSSMVEEMDVYIDEGGYVLKQTGRFVNPDLQQIKQLDEPKVRISLNSNQGKSVYFRIQYWEFPEEVYYLPDHVFAVRIERVGSFLDSISDFYFTKGLATGALTYFCLVGFILFFFTREVVYLYYAIHLFLFVLFGVNNRLILTEYVFPSYSEISKYVWVFGSSSLIFYLLFYRSFLRIKFYSVVWDRVILFFILVFSFVMIIDLGVAFFSDHSYEIGIIIHWAVLTEILLMVVLMGVALYFDFRNRLVQIVVIGTSVFLGSVLFFELSSYDHNSIGTEYALVFEAMALAIGLGYRIKIRNDNRKQELENEVLKRTEEIDAQRVELDKSNREKDLLLKEVHHRVKNNLQVISSLLNLQQKSMTDDSAKTAVSDGKERVKSIALIHKKLYENDDYSFIEMNDYVAHLVDQLLAVFKVSKESVELDISFPRIEADIDTAVPLGLIINELITNSLKYALPTVDNPRIKVDLHLREDVLILEVSDNGAAKIDQTADSFGLTIVRSLTRQLRGKMTHENTNGLHYKFEFTDFMVK